MKAINRDTGMAVEEKLYKRARKVVGIRFIVVVEE